MPADLVIGLDSSTTATKAIAWDRHGRAAAEGRAAVALANPQPGWFEQDPLDWWAAAGSALQELLRRVPASSIAAIAISNQRETFAQFDASGRPLRPGTVWLDERARQETTELADELGGAEIHRICGKPVDIIPCLYRGAWFRKHMPEIWTDMARTAEVHGYLAYRLTDRWVSSTGSADPMGLLDMAAMDWSDRLIGAIGLDRSRLPVLHRPGSRLGEISADAARATGLAAGTPVIAGGGDGQCAGTGTNVFVPGRAYINLGTAMVSGSFGRSYAYDNAFRTMTAIAEDGYIFESCVKSGTFLVNWLVERLFNTDPKANPQIFRELEAEAAASPIGANGIVVVPYWSQSMTPYWDWNARGLIAGLTSSHKRGDVYRAILEGLSLEQAMVTDRIAEVTAPIDHFVAIGGGASSDLWCQILADCTGRAVKRLSTVEASSLGAAIAAAKGAGWYGSIPEAAAAMSGTPVTNFTPDRARHARYRELSAIYRDLWPAVQNWNRRIAAFAEAS
jgi:xylulokinase